MHHLHYNFVCWYAIPCRITVTRINPKGFSTAKPFRTVASSVMALAIALSSQAIAHADPAPAPAVKHVVAFGDSFSANSSDLHNRVYKIPGAENTNFIKSYPDTEGCLQAPDNWPAQLRSKPGVASVADWSCNAQTSHTMLKRVSRAIKNGQLNKNTTDIVFAVGMNNYGPIGARDGVNITNYKDVSNAYVADMRKAASMVRSVAPKADLIVLGNIAVTDKYGNFCAVNVVPNAPGKLPLPLLRNVEHSNIAMQQRAATAIGGKFVEMRSGSLGHSTCGKSDSQRYVSGIVDTTTPHYNMAFHPSRAGSAYIANRVARAL